LLSTISTSVDRLKSAWRAAQCRHRRGPIIHRPAGGAHRQGN